MDKSTCKHCGKEIGKWTDPWGGHPQWMHQPDDGPDAYQSCHCQCDACKPDTTLGIHDPTPANCIDGEEAEPANCIDGEEAEPTLRNLERMWEVRDNLPQDKRAEFTATFIGALSVHVSDEIWDACMQTAKKAVEKEADRG